MQVNHGSEYRVAGWLAFLMRLMKKFGRRGSNPSQVTPNSTAWVAINPGQRSTAMPMGRITEVITRNTKTMQKVGASGFCVGN